MWRVQLFKLNYDEQEYQAVKETLDSEWLTMGQKTLDFESAFATFLGDNTQCLAVANGTAALHMAVLACGIKFGDEIITPALTFIADQNVTWFCGASNILADITSMEDWAMDPQEIENRITPNTKAVMIVHYAGYACEMGRIVDICRRHNLYLIEDCAHTPGADYGGQPLGTFGDVAAFSFFSNKNISVGEGGMVATKNPDIYARLKDLRSHGMTVPSFDRYQGRATSYDVELPGFNYRIDEIRSSLGLVQLQKLKVANQKRKDLVDHYWEKLNGISLIGIPYRHFSRGAPNYHIMPILLSEKIDRNKLIEVMKQEGIQTSIHYPAIQHFSAYKGKVNETPKATYVSAHELTLPLYPTMTFQEVNIVCDALVKGLS
jgi:dTDP-4-amino-4,6-dideoxygalactose transaminase